MNERQMTVIWNDGWNANKRGESRESNPHIGAYASDWFAGWDAAEFEASQQKGGEE